MVKFDHRYFSMLSTGLFIQVGTSHGLSSVLQGFVCVDGGGGGGSVDVVTVRTVKIHW